VIFALPYLSAKLHYGKLSKYITEPSQQKPATKNYVKPEAVITDFELLMMGGLSPKTC
jgi:hypothetical protein